MGEPQERSGRARRQRLAAAAGPPRTAPHRSAAPGTMQRSPLEKANIFSKLFFRWEPRRGGTRAARGGGQGRAAAGRGAQRGLPSPPRSAEKGAERWAPISSGEVRGESGGSLSAE